MGILNKKSRKLLKTVFAIYDEDGDGLLSEDEVTAGVQGSSLEAGWDALKLSRFGNPEGFMEEKVGSSLVVFVVWMFVWCIGVS